MPLAGSARTVLYGVMAALIVAVLAGATLAWPAVGRSTAGLVSAAAGDIVVEPEPPPTTIATTTSTSSTSMTSTSTTSTSMTTTTTVKPKPVTTTTRPRPVVTTPATAPPAAAPPTVGPPPVVLPGNTTPQERCANALEWVRARGLVLPAGWGYRCPGEAMVGGTPRWGVACWNCNGDGQSWIAVDIGRIGASEKALRYVVAHEICHALDYVTVGISTEIGADLCAGLHGAPRP